MKGSIRSQLREKIFSEKAKGEVITSSDFLAFWPRTAVDQALSRMARDGELKRILPGIYEIPATNKRFNLPVPTDPEQVAKAWARKMKLVFYLMESMPLTLCGFPTKWPGGTSI